MNYSIFRFTLNMHNHRSQASVSAFKGDTAVRLLINITDGGVPYIIEEGCVAVLSGTKADGIKFAHRCAIINSSTIQYDFTEQTASCVGIVNCELTLYGADGGVITAPKFVIVVDEKEVNGVDLLSELEHNLLADIFEKESKRSEAEIARRDAEWARVDAENARVEAEEARAEADEARRAELDQAVARAKAVAETAAQEAIGAATAKMDAWMETNDLDSETSGKINVIKSPYTVDEVVNNSIILSSGNIRTDGMAADKRNFVSPLIAVSEGVYGLKVKPFNAYCGVLGTDNNGYGLFASDGTTPVGKVSMVDKGNNIYLITVPASAKYIRFTVLKGDTDDKSLSVALGAFNSWILLPDATDDITDDFFVLGTVKENGTIEKIRRNDGSHLAIVDTEARARIDALEGSGNVDTDIVTEVSEWYVLNDFKSVPNAKTNAINAPYTADDIINHSIILSSGNIRTEGNNADKRNFVSPLIEVNEGVYGLKVIAYNSTVGQLGTDNNGYGLFAEDGITPVTKVSMVSKGNNIYLITVPADAKYIRFTVQEGTLDDSMLDQAIGAFNSWILLPDATDDITEDFFVFESTENGEISRIKRNDGSYLNIVDAGARSQVDAGNKALADIPLTFGRRTCAIFKKVCCIGDSYTAGYIMNTNGTPISNNDYSWVEHLKNFTGRDYVNCGISGASARTWLTDERGLAKAQKPENKAQAYVIGLQINDSSTSMASYTPVGSIEDIGTDAETYYGCMSKIVSEVFAINPLAHVFIQTQPKNFTGVHTPYRQAVIDIVAHFQNDGIHNNQVHLIDLLNYYKLYQNAGCNDSMVNGHFTAVGWEYCAEILAYAWSNYINANPLKFQDVNLIPYGVAN